MKVYTYGFSLLELAIVLFILALVLGGLLVPLATQQEANQRKDTTEQLKEIRQALYGFVLKNSRLPCPDISGNGEENRSAGGCEKEYGDLPSAILGIKGRDAWSRNFTYRVDSDFGDDPSKPTPDPSGETCIKNPSVSFTLCSEGDITVEDGDGSNVAQYIPAIVVSHGRNAVENNPSGYEVENLDDDKDFVDRDYSQKEGDEFDDLLIWISPHTLRNKMLEAGMLP